jgi:TRAP-type C4-dicarboxylate transport system substrate-binding protein
MEVVTSVDNQAFRNAMTPVWGDFAKQFGAENIRQIQEFK